MAHSPALLAVLEQEPAHGYTLKRRYDETFAPARPLAFGQVYASLARFEKRKWAEVVDVESGEGPERKRYKITPDGVDVVERWVYSAEPPEALADDRLLTKVSVALLSGRSADLVLANQRAAHLVRMRQLETARRDAADTAHVLAVTFQLAHLDADLRWIEETAHRLSAGPAAARARR